MSTVKKLFRGSIAQSLEVVIGIAIGLFMLPFMINQLGESLYGIWILIGGFTATLYLFDFGFASAVTRSMARHIAKGDDEAANRTVSTALVVYFGLACLVMVATALIAYFSTAWVDNPENVGLVRTLIIIAGFNLAIEFPFKAYAGIGTAYIRYDLMAWIRIVVRLIATAATIWALLSGYQLVAVALVQVGASVATNCALVFVGYHLHTPLKVRFSYVSKEVMRALVNYSSWAFLIDLARIGKRKAPLLLIAALLGTSALTVYYVATRLVEYSVQLISKATGMTTPIFAAYQAKSDMQGLQDKLYIFMRINFLVGFFVVFGFSLLGEPLIRLWMGADFPYQEAYHALVVIITGQIVAFTFSPISSVLLAIARHRWQAFLTIGEVILTVAIIYLALSVFEMGLIGAAIGSALPVVISRSLLLPCIIHREIKVPIFGVYRSLLKPAVLLIVVTLLSSEVLKYVDVTTIAGLIGAGFLVSIIYWSLTLLALRPEEWGYLIKMLPNKLATPLQKRFRPGI